MYFSLNWLKNSRPGYALIAVSLLVLLNTGCSSPAKQRVVKSQSYSGQKSELVANAHLLLGTPYRYGGSRPSTGFDCSGFVQYAHSTIGVQLPRTSKQQYRVTKPVRKRHLRPGDLVFFRIDRKRTVSHVGIYIGSGKFIHAPSSGKRVSIARLDNPYWQRHYDSAGRVF